MPNSYQINAETKKKFSVFQTDFKTNFLNQYPDGIITPQNLINFIKSTNFEEQNAQLLGLDEKGKKLGAHEIINVYKTAQNENPLNTHAENSFLKLMKMQYLANLLSACELNHLKLVKEESGIHIKSTELSEEERPLKEHNERHFSQAVITTTLILGLQFIPFSPASIVLCGVTGYFIQNQYEKLALQAQEFKKGKGNFSEKLNTVENTIKETINILKGFYRSSFSNNPLSDIETVITDIKNIGNPIYIKNEQTSNLTNPSSLIT